MSDYEFYYPEPPLTDEQRRARKRERLKRLRAMDRRSQAESRKYRRQEIDDALRAPRALKAAGFPPRSVTVGGKTFELGQPEAAAPNEWDLDLGTNTPQTRQ